MRDFAFPPAGHPANAVWADSSSEEYLVLSGLVAPGSDDSAPVPRDSEESHDPEETDDSNGVGDEPDDDGDGEGDGETGDADQTDTSSDPSSDDDRDGDSKSGDDRDEPESESDDDGTPGFGIASGAASLGGAGYLLKR